jgi:hypothetical protein
LSLCTFHGRPKLPRIIHKVTPTATARMEQPTSTRFDKASSVESATVSGSDAQAGIGLSNRIPLPGAIPDDAVSPTYARKAHVLNAAIQEIGMGRYQWGLFFVAGFGWCADNVCLLWM